MSPNLQEADLTRSVIGAFFEVYNNLGYGFLEHVYVLALHRELTRGGHAVALETAVNVTYKGEYLTTHRLDMLVDDRVIVEVKSSEVLPRFGERQLHNYLKGTGIEVGLLLHFGPAPKFYRQFVKRTPYSPARSGKSARSDSMVVPKTEVP